ncbi:MAG TPA: hypothetical protein VJQ46_01055 [Gemmatimonadales bacterium]|nr:hypothetical protein [Gemmatimonadales bacterium]
MPRRSIAPFLACVVLLAACSAKARSDGDSPRPLDAPASVRVENRDFLDMTIYVIDGSQRVRLGVANGNKTTELRIPQYLVRGPAHLKFLCDPIGGRRSPVSDEITVEPGDVVTLTIPAS